MPCTVHLRFLQLQRRGVERAGPAGGYTPVPELTVAGRTWLAWDEAVEREVALGPDALAAGTDEHPVEVAGGEDVEPLGRRRAHRGPAGPPPAAAVGASVTVADAVRARRPGLLRLGVGVRNATPSRSTTATPPPRDPSSART